MTKDRTPLATELQARYAKGDIAGVIDAARKAPAAIAADAEASLFTGLAHAGAGAFGEAVGHLRTALRLKPDDPGAKGALARVLLLRGESEEAEVLIDELAAAARTDVLAVLHLSDTYLQAGRSEAAFHFLSGARVSFDHSLIDVRLAEMAIRTRRIDAAIAAARLSETRLGAHPSALNVAGPAALIADDQAWFKKVRTAVEQHPAPRAAAIFDNWANMLMACDQLPLALISAELAVNMQATAQRWRLASDLRLAARQTSGAEAAALAALACDPEDSFAMALLARCRMMSGEIADAKRLLLDAIRIDSACAVAFDYLTQIDPEAMTAEMAERLEDLVASGALPSDSRPKALLALARRSEAEGEPALAFARIIKAKSMIAKAARDSGGGYRPHEIDAAVERMRRNFAKPPSAVDESSKPRLIFVIGMPRSGTSLVEQILSSHTSVYGAGELPGMIAIMKDFDRRAMAADAAAVLATNAGAWRMRYLDALPSEARAAAVVTDKHPINFWSVGLVRTLFPDAKIVNLQRSPIDVCLSILRYRFFAEYTFANEIDAVAHHYAAYERLMAHWRAIYGDAIYDIGYETLVATPEASVRAMLARCGLPWEEQCLDFHKTKRDVLTHSAAQVREPINTRGVERRRKYGDSLLPLEEALARFGVQAR